MELSTYRLCRKHHLIAAADRTATECIGSSRHGRCHHSRFRRRLLLGGLDHHLAIEHLLFCFLPLLRLVLLFCCLSKTPGQTSGPEPKHAN